MKATHYGHCQLCGRQQKLPNGLLAKHGYEVSQWGFFHGVCPGSAYAPYEFSCDLIAAQILLQEAAFKDVLETAKATRELRKQVWVRERRYDHGGALRFGWRLLEAKDVSIKEYAVQWLGADGKPHSNRSLAPGSDAIKQLNALRAEEYEREAKQRAGYIDYLRLRRKAWKLSELQAI